MDPAHESKLDQFNQHATNQSRIYPERLEEGTARILILCRGSTSDEIKCNLKQKVLLAPALPDKVESYEALSYVWGEEENSGSVVLCGSHFTVTRNLMEVLRQLRLPDRDRMLWVDAICINQRDEEEKATHIKSMNRIYELAERVIAWLGPSNDACNSAYWFMNLIQNPDIAPTAPVMTLSINNEGTHTELDSFGKLMNQPYWSRAWVVQEMMFARSLVIRCGSDEVPYSALENAFPPDKPATITFHSDKGKPMRMHFHGGPKARMPRLDSKQMCPKRFLDCFLDRQCLKRHDNIFAFLNLLSDDIRQKIPISYKTDICEVVRHTVRAIIESTQSLYVIVIKGRQAPPSAQGDDKWQLDMPSWWPYFATPYECCSIESQDKPSLFTEKAIVSFIANDRLRVKGFLIGRVLRPISRHIQHIVGATDWWDQTDMDREWKHYRECLALGLNGAPKDIRTKLMSAEAITRTLFAGRGGDLYDALVLMENGTGDAVEGPEVSALRKIWDIGNSRLVCSFRLDYEVDKELWSSKVTSTARIKNIALVPRTVRQGDVICAISGCPTPVVLRERGDCYHVLGEAYVDPGVVGQFEEDVRLRDFTLG